MVCKNSFKCSTLSTHNLLFSPLWRVLVTVNEVDSAERSLADLFDQFVLSTDRQALENLTDPSLYCLFGVIWKFATARFLG